MTAIVAAVWLLIQVDYHHNRKVTVFEGPHAEEMCWAARSFLTLRTRDSYCVDP